MKIPYFSAYRALLLFSVAISACSARRLASGLSAPAIDSTLINVKLNEPEIRYFNDSTLLFSTAYDAARLNVVRQVNDSTFELSILPENTPINPSPWYGFKLWSRDARNISLRLSYGEFKHRYHPKLRMGETPWRPVKEVRVSKDRKHADFRLHVGPDTVQISAQEHIPAAEVYAWIDSLEGLPHVRTRVIGHSVLQQPVVALYTPAVKSRKAVLFMSRQHPPEITGFLAHNAFMEEVLGPSDLAMAFRREFQILDIPMVNPDGVDAGHWRHNMGGVDLNRDWEKFRQPETRAIRDFLEQLVEKKGTRLFFSLDFHSTFHDVYYINQKVDFSFLPGFSKAWIAAIEEAIPGYTASVKPSSNGGNVSKGWLSRRFGTEAITYEVGDGTDRADVAHIARTAARKMMERLLKKEGRL